MKIKKLFPVKRMSKKNLLEFLDKRGFYIVLILCIAIVGVTAVFLTTQNFNSPEDEFISQGNTPEEPDTGVSSNTDNNSDTKNSPQSSISTPLTTEGSSKTVEKSGDSKAKENKSGDDKDKNASPTPGKTKESSAPAKEEPVVKFTMPVFGEIIFDYAEDKLVYSTTLEDWRTHSGIDLAANRGTPVKATADGVVYEVKNDPRFGITVLIDHQNGLKTVYSNLASDKSVTPNQKVKQGEVIGSVGNTAIFESAEQPHLHFEVLKNNKPVNPNSFLPKNN